ncbi:MAG: chloride channel protein [Desulfobacterota bacterium]|jgi:CIC family chloride channel protein|nr:chloride channel protein [Thermodesulfobacteriota bacterium]
MAALATLVGLAAGFGALGFRYLVQVFQFLAYGSPGNLLEIIASVPWYTRLWLPALGGLSVGFVIHFFIKESKGIGIADVMEAVALRKGVIKKRLLFSESLTSGITIGTGGSAGVIAPIVFIGSSLGSIAGQLLGISPDRMRTLVGCGAAGGIAAIFNAPIGGCMFALEVILGDFGLASFSPIVISSVVATVVSRHFLGNFPAILVPPYQLVSAWELPLYALLGLLSALVAALFTTSLYRTEEIFQKMRFPDVLKAGLGGLLTGLIALLFPHVLGTGFPAIDLALAGQLSWVTMLLLIGFKILATSITLGSGGSGGTFAPALLLGSMAGGAFGNAVHWLLPEVTASPGAYSIVGMAGVLSGTIHGPLSAILILFEMTDNYRIILPLMIACIISFITSTQISRESIFTLKLVRKGINIKAGKEVNVLKSLLVEKAMNPAPETIYEGLPLNGLARHLSESKYHSFPIVDGSGHLTGILSYVDYHEVLHNQELDHLVVVKDIATEKVITAYPDESLYAALEKIAAKDFSILPVVDRENPNRLLGIITRRDIIGAYNSAVIKQSPRREQSPPPLASS